MSGDGDTCSNIDFGFVDMLDKNPGIVSVIPTQGFLAYEAHCLEGLGLWCRCVHRGWGCGGLVGGVE